MAPPMFWELGTAGNCEDEGILAVPETGEMLYRLANGTIPEIDFLCDKERRNRE